MPIANFLPMPAWRDLVDILFLTLVAYQLYEWFRETRALKVIIGLAALGVIYSIARLWGLFLTTWAFQILWQVLLILLLILFQSEIRQVLEKVSPLRYLRSRRQVLRGTYLKDLTGVLFELADEKTGALVVLTRDDSVSEFLRSGHEIMAKPDAALIKSIFNRHAPAHDGAVIISNERMTHMGCILPLSTREDLPEKYGTRHRAALGLCEVSDAVCLVVSEERAEVSAIVGDNIVTWQEPENLTVKLKSWIGGPEIQMPAFKAFLQGLFVHNWKTKLAALALVTAAWIVLAGQQEISVSLDAPIRHINLPPGLVLEEASAHEVSLKLSGRRRGIGALKRQDVDIVVDLRHFSPGEHQLKLSAKNIDLPFGLEIDNVSPESIAIVLSAAGETPPAVESNIPVP